MTRSKPFYDPYGVSNDRNGDTHNRNSYHNPHNLSDEIVNVRPVRILTGSAMIGMGTGTPTYGHDDSHDFSSEVVTIPLYARAHARTRIGTPDSDPCMGYSICWLS